MKLTLSDIGYQAGDFKLGIDTLEIRQGEFFTLLGPSGCGKSTLLRLIAGLIPLESGSIWINERRIDHLPSEKRDIGMVFQDLALFPHMNVNKNIGYGLRSKKLQKSEYASTVAELLTLVSLPGYDHRRIETLSGGEKQRVAIARSLATRPALLLLDEPLSSLDAHLRRSLRREIKQLHNRLKFTCIYVTHDQEEALALSDRIAIIFDGAIAQIDTAPQLYHRPATLRCAEFLGFSNNITVDAGRKRACIRPADCRVLPLPRSDSSSDEILIPGTVSYSEYTGAGYLYGIVTEQGLLQGLSKTLMPTATSCALCIPKSRLVRF